MLQELSAKFYLGMGAIVFTLQWLYVMFGTFRKREAKIDWIKELNRFIEETFDSESEAYLFLLILVASIIWPVTLIVVTLVIIASFTLHLTRIIINRRIKNNENKTED